MVKVGGEGAAHVLEEEEEQEEQVEQEEKEEQEEQVEQEEQEEQGEQEGQEGHGAKKGELGETCNTECNQSYETASTLRDQLAEPDSVGSVATASEIPVSPHGSEPKAGESGSTERKVQPIKLGALKRKKLSLETDEPKVKKRKKTKVVVEEKRPDAETSPSPWGRKSSRLKSHDTEEETAKNLLDEPEPKDAAAEENKQLQQSVKVDVVKVRTPERPVEAAAEVCSPVKRRSTSAKRPAAASPPSKVAAGSSPKKPAAAAASPRAAVRLRCGVCGAAARSGKSWAAHRARQHAGLARLTGEEQSFTREQEAAAVTAAFLTCRRIVCPRCRRRHFTQPAVLVEHLQVCGVQEEVPEVVPEVQGRSRRAAATRAKSRVAEFVKRITGRYDGESEGEAEEPSEDGSDDCYEMEKEEEEEEQTESEQEVESEQESEEYEEDSDDSEERPRGQYRRRRRSGGGGAGLRRAILEPCPQVLGHGRISPLPHYRR